MQSLGLAQSAAKLYYSILVPSKTSSLLMSKKIAQIKGIGADLAQAIKTQLE